MEKTQNFNQSILRVALVTGLILSVPLIAMQFSTEVDWSVGDFIIMGILIFSAGMTYVLITRYAPSLLYRLAVASAIGSTLLLIWVNLAVGLIGGGPNAGNFMYIGVIAVVIIGTILSRFTAKGMELAMFATSLSVVLIAIIALLTNMDEYPGSSVQEIIGVNAFFATLFAVSGLLFRFIAMENTTERANG